MRNLLVVKVDAEGRRVEMTLLQAIDWLRSRIVGYSTRTSMARLAESWKHRPITFGDGSKMWLLED